MKKQQWVIKWLALLVAGLLLAGCTKNGAGQAALPPAPGTGEGGSSASALAAPVRLAVLMPEDEREFMQKSLQAATEKLEALARDGSAEIMLKTAPDAAGLAGLVDEALAWEANVVLLWPPDETGSLPQAAGRVLGAGCRLVLFGRTLEGVAPTATIMGDDVAIGQWTAQYLLKAFADDLAQGRRVGYLRFCGGASGLRQKRSEGMDEALAAMGFADAFEPLAPDIDTGWEGQSAYDDMAAWLYQATAEQRAALRFVVTQEDTLAEGVADAIEDWLAENPGSLDVRLITGVGARGATLDRFFPPRAEGPGQNEDASDDTENNPPAAGAPRLVTYYYSPVFVQQGIDLALAAARGTVYNGQDIGGQTFLIPPIEVDAATVNAFRAGGEYAATEALAT